MTATASTTSSAAWTAIRRSTTPTSPRPAASATSASSRSTNRAFTASCSPRATSAGRSARIATPRTKSRRRRTATSKWPATSAAANATRIGSNIIATPITARPWRWANRTVAADVAACYDCHGHHDVLPPSNPASRLSKTNILATCQQCHPTATAGFTDTGPHANPLDRENYPMLHLVFLGMTGLLIGVFSFFGLHTIVWLARVIYISLHDTKSFREAKDQNRGRHGMVHALCAVRALPAFPRGDELPAAGHHRHAAEVLLHRLGEGAVPLHRRRRDGAHVASLRRGGDVPLLRPACGLARGQILEGPAAICATRPPASCN